MCPILCDPRDCSLTGFSIHGILQARILEWVVVPSSRGSSDPRNKPRDLVHLLHWQVDSLPLSRLGSPRKRERTRHFPPAVPMVCVTPATWVALHPSRLPSIPSSGPSLAPLLLTSFYSCFPDSCLLYLYSRYSLPGKREAFTIPIVTLP